MLLGKALCRHDARFATANSGLPWAILVSSLRDEPTGFCPVKLLKKKTALAYAACVSPLSCSAW